MTSNFSNNHNKLIKAIMEVNVPDELKKPLLYYIITHTEKGGNYAQSSLTRRYINMNALLRDTYKSDLFKEEGENKIEVIREEASRREDTLQEQKDQGIAEVSIPRKDVDKILSFGYDNISSQTIKKYRDVLTVGLKKKKELFETLKEIYDIYILLLLTSGLRFSELMENKEFIIVNDQIEYLRKKSKQPKKERFTPYKLSVNEWITLITNLRMIETGFYDRKNRNKTLNDYIKKEYPSINNIHNLRKMYRQLVDPLNVGYNLGHSNRSDLYYDNVEIIEETKEETKKEDRDFCEKCNKSYLKKNRNRHLKTKTHINKL